MPRNMYVCMYECLYVCMYEELPMAGRDNLAAMRQEDTRLVDWDDGLENGLRDKQGKSREKKGNRCIGLEMKLKQAPD